jgi:hypothetical protein
MAVGDSGKHVPSNVPGHGPKPAAPMVGKHVRGSGSMPGTGPMAGPSSQGNGNKGSAGGVKNP